MNKGCIPMYDPKNPETKKWYPSGPDDMKRAFFFIPKNDDSKELFECIKKIDDYMFKEINTNKNKNKIICLLKGDKRSAIGGLTYKRMITTTKPPGAGIKTVDEEDDDNTKNKNSKGGNNREFVPWDRIKVRFSTLFDKDLGQNDPKDINTQIYIGDNEEAEPFTTVTQIETKFSRNCLAQYALQLSKFWSKTDDTMECSITIKCVQLCVREVAKKGSLGMQLSKRLFPPMVSGQGNDNSSKKK